MLKAGEEVTAPDNRKARIKEDLISAEVTVEIVNHSSYPIELPLHFFLMQLSNDEFVPVNIFYLKGSEFDDIFSTPILLFFGSEKKVLELACPAIDLAEIRRKLPLYVVQTECKWRFMTKNLPPN